MSTDKVPLMMNSDKLYTKLANYTLSTTQSCLSRRLGCQKNGVT